MVIDKTTEVDDTQPTGILVDIKKMLGLAPEQTDFDDDIIIHINTAISILDELGISPTDIPFEVTGTEEQWTDYIPEINKYREVKTYIYLKVKSIFDPSLSSSVQQAIDRQLGELEMRLQVKEKRESGGYYDVDL